MGPAEHTRFRRNAGENSVPSPPFMECGPCARYCAAMSEENLEIARAWVAAWHGVDQVPVFQNLRFTPAMKAFAARYPHPEFEMEVVGDMGKLGRHSGHGFFEGWAEVVLAWESLRHEYEEPIDCGDKVLIPARQYARPKGSAVEIEQRSAALMHFEEGKLKRFEAFLQEQDALEAAGLSE
jgi:hypothetical protein